MKIRQLTLQVESLAALAAFYSQTLGLPTAWASQDELRIQAGQTCLTLRQGQPQRSSPYHFAFNIPENQIEAAVHWLEGRATRISNHAGQNLFASKSWNADMFYFYDPEGNILELIARHTLLNASDQPFSSASILSISEIGLAVETVPKFVELLRAKLGLTPYLNESSETFTAVGDANGLLIIVKNNRIWFPETGVAAQPNPIEIELEIDAKIFSLSGLPYQISPA